MPLPDLHASIPHRPPMLLLDQVVSCDESTIVCRKTFRSDEFFLQGHYPGYPLVPGVILCECAMQAGGVLLANRLGSPAGIPVATRMDRVQFRRMIRPGETVEIEVRLREQVSQAFYLDGRVRCDAVVAARLEFACTLSPHPEPSGTP
jgi:3-hydroxyacyl-[acyl-carrier-protein] dehydratase